MLTRRRFVGYSALSSSLLACPPLLKKAFAQTAPQKPLRLAILGSVYHPGSHLQTIADRFLVGYPFEGEWHMPNVQVVALFVDQRSRRADAAPMAFQRTMSGESGAGRRAATTPKPAEALTPTTDLSQSRSQQFGFRLARNIPEALRCGGDQLAIDAVLAIVEQDDYPVDSHGRTLLPNFDFFQQCTQVFEAEGRSVPYFNHNQLSFSFSEARKMVETADRLKFPLLGGSSMPVTWRLPDTDVPLNARVQEAVMVGVGAFDTTAFEALDAMQSMLERRQGGETGVKAVQLLEGDDVWTARAASRWSNDLLSAALSRSDTPLGLTLLDGRTQDLAAPGLLQQLVPNPVAILVEYTDGTRATLLLLNGAIRDFNIAARVDGHDIVSTQFFMTPDPNQTYSACLASKIEHLFQTRTAPYPVQRTLLTTGILEASLNSRHRLNQRLETPHLAIAYQPPTDSQYIRT